MTIPVSKSVGAVVVNDQHDVLLVYRTYQMFWEFPKGKVIPGESEEETLRRELKEEIGVTEFDFIQPFREEVFFDFQLGEDTIHRHVVYFAIQTNDPVRISKEHSQVGWFSFDEAKKRLRFDNYRNLIDKLQSLLAQRSP